jgi:hypothetical protein
MLQLRKSSTWLSSSTDQSPSNKVDRQLLHPSLHRGNPEYVDTTTRHLHVDFRKCAATLVRHLDKQMRTITVAFLIGCSTFASAQSSRTTLGVRLQQLRSEDWRVRAKAVLELEADTNVRRTPETKRALVQLLDRENRYLTNPRRSDSEEYAEYYSQLVGRVFSFVDSADAFALSVIARSSYNGDSPMAIQLASYGQTVVAPLLERARDQRHPEWRPDAYEVLGYVLQHHRLNHTQRPLTERAVRDVENTLRAGLRDSKPYVRSASIRGVMAAGDAPSLPILEEVHTSDPWVSHVTGTHTIRELAGEAIAAIKANPLSK